MHSLSLKAATLVLLGGSRLASCQQECGPSSNTNFEYEVTPEEGFDIRWSMDADAQTISFEVVSAMAAWVGIAFPSTELEMIGADAVIGLPDDLSVMEYNMTTHSVAGVAPFPDQEITGGSVSQDGVSGATTLTFTRPMAPAGTKKIISATPGDLTSIIYAFGGDNELAYHGSNPNRNGFEVDVFCGGTGDATVAGTVAPAATPTMMPTETPAAGGGGDVTSSAAPAATPTMMPTETPAAGGGGDVTSSAAPAAAAAPTLPAPTTAPSAGNSSTVDPLAIPPSDESASSTTPMVAGVVSAVAGVALIALGFWCRRRQTAEKMGAGRLVPPANGDDNLEHGREHDDQQGVSPHNTSVVVDRGDNQPPYQNKPAEVAPDGEEGVVSTSETTPAGSVPSSTEQTTQHAGKDGGVALPGAVAEECSAQQLLAAANSTANVSIAEGAELVGISSEDAALFADEPMQASGKREASSTTTSRRGSASDVGVGQAVMVAAQELAHSCQIPGVSEAATLVSILVNLVTDSRDNNSGGGARLRQCRSIVMVLHQAVKIAGKGEDTVGEVARVLIEDVNDAIFDLVELIKTYQSKKKLSKVLMSTLFKRRQDELDAVVDRAIVRLQLGLQVQVGHDVSAVKKGMDLFKGSIAEAKSESLAEARSTRRRRKLDQVEIPEEHVAVTDELLGKGGFGEVYLADYNGRNAAAKVLRIAHELGHDLGALGESDVREGPLAGRSNVQRENSQRRAFLRELDAMIRLRSPHTVNVYGAVTSLPDRMVLVMELLAGGDLRTLLRNSEQRPLPEEQSRRIIGDICAGMTFLHSKDTVHGDLKSANVLLDGAGRAKIGDFGTSRWSQHTNSTGLATYTTKSSQSTQMSLAWSAPEVLESGGSTYASDVYSFGIVVWEVASGELPWANKTRPRDVLSAVLMGVRPSFRDDAPAYIVEIAKACWDGEPEARTTFGAVMEGIKSKGWSE